MLEIGTRIETPRWRPLRPLRCGRSSAARARRVRAHHGAAHRIRCGADQDRRAHLRRHGAGVRRTWSVARRHVGVQKPEHFRRHRLLLVWFFLDRCWTPLRVRCRWQAGRWPVVRRRRRYLVPLLLGGVHHLHVRRLASHQRRIAAVFFVLALTFWALGLAR